MTQSLIIPVKEVRGDKWGCLDRLCDDHEIVGYDFKLKNDQYSFAGGHRVRLYKVKGNVHFRVPIGVTFDISSVPVQPSHQGKSKKKRKTQ